MILCLRYGAIAAVLLTLFTYAPYFVPGFAPWWAGVNEIAGHAATASCLSATWLAMRSDRRVHGALAAGRALAIGAGVIAVAAATAAALAWWVYTAGADTVPGALHDAYVLQVRTSGASGSGIDRALAEAEAVRPLLFDPAVQAAGTAAAVVVFGVLHTLAGAWWLRTRTSARP